MIIDVHKTITRNLSCRLKKEPNMKGTGVTLTISFDYLYALNSLQLLFEDIVISLLDTN